MPHLLCVSVETEKTVSLSILYELCVCMLAFMHELIHRHACVGWAHAHTHSLGTEFFCQEELDLTAKPAGKQTQRMRGEKR